MITSVDEEKDKVKQFEENERKRMKAEIVRQELKHKKQWDELKSVNIANEKELEQIQNEKRKMLIEQESEKIKQHEQSYQQELSNWKANLRPRKQILEDEFAGQRKEQEAFYGSHLWAQEGQANSAALSAADISGSSDYSDYPPDSRKPSLRSNTSHTSSIRNSNNTVRNSTAI